MKVGLVYAPVYLGHDTGEHPENRQRLEAIILRLKESGLWEKLTHIAPRQATLDELLHVHSEKHIRFVRELAASGGGQIDADTLVSRHSFKAALYAAGGVASAVDAVMGGEVGSAFALVRPPGHHATYEQVMGFCLFNNVAVAAAHALDRYGLERVLILDFDVHHGNGTQDIFRDEPRVCYVSTHQSPLYPGSGDVDERGAGNMFNIPLPSGCGDDQYERVYDEIVLPLGRRFRPQLILVSAGFDAHWADELASMCLSTSGYAQITRRIKALAHECCGGKVVFSLEGGYNLEALAGSVKAVFDVLMGNENIDDELGPCRSGEKSPDVKPSIARLRELFELS
ncbi:MAG: histone deacetylase [Dehalococcoidia bacterium]|nr:MAG: histone deacetylase [Dehalococcoidia bacterium]